MFLTHDAKFFETSVPFYGFQILPKSLVFHATFIENHVSNKIVECTAVAQI